MTAAAWRKITIEQKGMAHTSEILSKIVKNKIKIKEVPIKVTYHDFGQKFSGGIRIIKDMILAKLMD
jgi:polyprenyl-phospho-N-acetylgalactosaminyl synthase